VPTRARVRTLGERVRAPDDWVLLRDTKKTAHYVCVCVKSTTNCALRVRVFGRCYRCMKAANALLDVFGGC
jgi:hypothetical protein